MLTMEMCTCLLAGELAGIVFGSNLLLLLILAAAVFIWRRTDIRKAGDEEDIKQGPIASFNGNGISERQNSSQPEDVVIPGGVTADHNLYQGVMGPLCKPINARICPWSPYTLENDYVSPPTSLSSQPGILILMMCHGIY
jgi:hypothetical protein